MSELPRVQDAELATALSSLNIESRDDVLIAVVGVTGSGKSKFLQMVTGNENIIIGHNYTSETSVVQSYPFQSRGLHFQLIDTPGFDDSDRDDEEIFLEIAKWLKSSYDEGQKLTGILYLHRIIDNREKGSELRNLRMFQRLCGEGNFRNVVLGITFWDREDPQVALERQKELEETPEFWGDMIKRHSKVVRIPHTREEGIALLEKMAENRPVTLTIQDEMAQGLTALQTTAATALLCHGELKAMRKKEAAEKIRQEHQHQTNRARLRELVRDEQSRLQNVFEERQQTLEAEALQVKKLEQEKYTRSMALGTHKRIIESEKQAKELAEMNEWARRQCVQRERDKAAWLRRLRISKEKKRSQAHSQSLRSQWNLMKRCCNLVHQLQEFDIHNSQCVQPLFFCDLCMKHSELGTFRYLCEKCLPPGEFATGLQFLMCDNCHANGKSCWCPDEPENNNHLIYQYVGGTTDFMARGKRSTSDGLLCDNCKKAPGSLYLHCHDCKNNDYDLCVHCWGVRRATCKQGASLVSSC